MATQYDPIAKDGSLNTTEATPRNIADVLAEELSGIASALTPAQLASLADVTISSPSDGQTLKYDAVSQKWVNANDAGGHIIENPNGTDMTQRGNLQFADAHLTDDSVNDRTKVEIAKEVTEAAFDSLNPVGTEHDGAYLMEVADAVPLTADMVGYDGGTVKGKLDELDDSTDYLMDAQFQKAVTISTVAAGGKYYAILGHLPIVYPAMPTIDRVNVLGVGDATITDFTVAALDANGNYYMSTTNSSYGGKALWVEMSI